MKTAAEANSQRQPSHGFMHAQGEIHNGCNDSHDRPHACPKANQLISLSTKILQPDSSDFQPENLCP
jgi:hypothetical protein